MAYRKSYGSSRYRRRGRRYELEPRRSRRIFTRYAHSKRINEGVAMRGGNRL